MRKALACLPYLSGLFFVALVLASSSVAFSAQGVFTPKIMVQAAYDDNVVMKGKSDFEIRTTPSAIVKYGDEDWKIEGGGSAALFRYLEYDQYERENYTMWLGGEKELTERVSVNFDASFNYDHTFVDELTQSGTETDTALRRKYDLTPGLTWSLSEKDQLNVSVPLSETKYAGKTNPDSSGFGSTVGWTHVLNNEKTSLLVQSAYNHYYYRRTDGDTNQDVFNAMLGMSYNPSELLNLRGLVGLTYADTTVSILSTSDKSSKKASASFDFSGTYSREKWKFTLGADRQVAPSIYGESSMRTRGRVSGEYFFTERLSSYCEAAIYSTESGGLVSDNKTRTYYIRPWLKYRWSENSNVRLEFKHTNVENRISNKTNEQNRIALRYEYEYPAFF